MPEKEIPLPYSCGGRAALSVVMGPGVNETQHWRDWFNYSRYAVILCYGISLGSGRMKRRGGAFRMIGAGAALNMGGGIRQSRMADGGAKMQTACNK
jgi:hypothetical protein